MFALCITWVQVMQETHYTGWAEIAGITSQIMQESHIAGRAGNADESYTSYKT